MLRIATRGKRTRNGLACSGSHFNMSSRGSAQVAYVDRLMPTEPPHHCMSAERDSKSPTEDPNPPSTPKCLPRQKCRSSIRTPPKNHPLCAQNHYFASTDVVESSLTITRPDDVLDRTRIQRREQVRNCGWRILEPVASALLVCNVLEEVGFEVHVLVRPAV